MELTGIDQSRAQQSELAEEETAWLCLCAGSSPRSDCPPAAQAVMSDQEVWGGAGQLSPHQLLQLLLDGRGWGGSPGLITKPLQMPVNAPPACSWLHGRPLLLRTHHLLLLNMPSLLETKGTNSRCLCEASEALHRDGGPQLLTSLLHQGATYRRPGFDP